MNRILVNIYRDSKLESHSSNLNKMIGCITHKEDCLSLEGPQDFHILNGKKIIFAIELSKSGVNIEFEHFLEEIQIKCEKNAGLFNRTVAGIFITSPCDDFTKSYARSVIFRLNRLGISFIGSSVVEATASLSNLQRWTSILNMTNEEVLVELSKSLHTRLRNLNIPSYEEKKALVVHASNRATSNSLMLWDQVKASLKGVETEELFIGSEVINDCNGCRFEACLEFSKNESCFFKDFITSEVLPKLKSATTLVLICPNYNDSVSAKIMAVINRMTVLYRSISFNEKEFYALIISGNSGGNCVAEQLIGSLNVNKGFYLPPQFTLLETANFPLTILKNADAVEHARFFADHISPK